MAGIRSVSLSLHNIHTREHPYIHAHAYNTHLIPSYVVFFTLFRSLFIFLSLPLSFFSVSLSHTQQDATIRTVLSAPVDVLYHPQTRQTRAVYEVLLHFLQREMGDKSHGVIRSAAGIYVVCVFVCVCVFVYDMYVNVYACVCLMYACGMCMYTDEVLMILKDEDIKVGADIRTHTQTETYTYKYTRTLTIFRVESVRDTIFEERERERESERERYEFYIRYRYASKHGMA